MTDDSVTALADRMHEVWQDDCQDGTDDAWRHAQRLLGAGIALTRTEHSADAAEGLLTAVRAWKKARWESMQPLEVGDYELADQLAKAERAAQPADVASHRDEALTFAELAATNRARCESPDGFGHPLDGWSLSDWFLAAIGEFGEAANVAKKLNRVRDGIPGNKETPDELRAKLRGEVADALIYLDLLAQSAGFSLEEAVVATFNAKSEQIGAPQRLAQRNKESGE